MKPVKTIDDPRYVRAVAHPLRIRILAMLGETEASPVELAPRLGATLGTVAYHVRTLHKLGLIELAGERRVRGAIEHIYRARPHPRISDDGWAQAPAIAKQAAVGSALQVIGEYATAAAAAGGFDRPEAHLTRTTLSLDEQGLSELSALLTDVLGRAEAIQDAAVGRIERSDVSHGQDVTLVMLLFDAARLTGPSTRNDKHRRPAKKGD